MNKQLTFSPNEPRDLDAPDYRAPIKILLDNQEVGYFLFSHENVFQIFLFVDYASKPGWREVLLDQTFSHEEKCRDWLIDTMSAICMGYKLHPLS